MRLDPRSLALSLFAALSACNAVQDESPNAKTAHEPALAAIADPMARSARMIGGEWRMTFASGTSMITTSHWGPGKHSLRSMTHGSEASGDPWRDLGVAYWHPGRKQIRVLGVTPFARGVSEGVVTVEGETSVSVIDQYQIGDRRQLVSRTVFDGPDKYRSELLERTSPGVLTAMTGWDILRSWTLTPVRPLTAQEAGEPSKHLKVLEPFLGQAWETTDESRGERGADTDFHTTVEWIPLADAIYARVLAQNPDGEPAHLFDAYLYHHTGTGALRCLALSQPGGVYEGDWTVLEGGALQLDLKGYAGEALVPYVVQFDFEGDGTLRQRVWSISGTDRALVLDVHHRKVAPKQD